MRCKVQEERKERRGRGERQRSEEELRKRERDRGQGGRDQGQGGRGGCSGVLCYMYMYDVRAHNIDIETEIFQQILRCCNSRMSSTRSEVHLHVQCI